METVYIGLVVIIVGFTLFGFSLRWIVKMLSSKKSVGKRGGPSEPPPQPETGKTPEGKEKKPDAKKGKKWFIYGIIGVVLAVLWYTGHIGQLIDWIAKPTAPTVKWVQPVEVGTQDYNTEANVWTPAFTNPWQKVAWRVGVNVPYYEVRINQKDSLIFRIDPNMEGQVIPPSISIQVLEFRTPANSRVVIYKKN